MPDLVEAELACGVEAAGKRQRRAVLRRLCGRDELALAEAPSLLPVEQADRLLALSCLAIGSLENPGGKWLDELVLGDRNLLLLAAYELNFAGPIDAVTTCRKRGCATLLDLELQAAGMIGAARREPLERELQVAFEFRGRLYEASLHLPRARDLAAAARAALEDPRAGGRLLLERALDGVACENRRRPAALRTILADGTASARLEAALAQADGFARLEVQVVCPACGTTDSMLFDPGRFLVDRLRSRRSLLDEVDLIARHYHWSEAEILDLPLARRRAYLARIEAQLGEAA
jgi:hypothetical protein